MSERPSISVLIPTYNYARYLKEAVVSVLEQDCRDMEVLISDDASTDETVEICRSLKALDNRVRFFQHGRNIGMVENWNWCLEHARGKYVKYLMADDKLCDPSALSRMVSTLEADAGVTLVASARGVIDEHSQPIDTWRPLGTECRRMTGDEIVAAYLDRDAKHINSIGEPSAVMFRRADARRGFSTKYRQLVDLEMWFFLLRKGDLYYIPDVLCAFRKHEKQQSVVHQGQCIHQKEEVELCIEYAHRQALKRVLFHKMRRMSKDPRPEIRAIVNRIKADFTPEEYAYRYLQYKLCRPFENLKRSAEKRGERQGGNNRELQA